MTLICTLQITNEIEGLLICVFYFLNNLIL